MYFFITKFISPLWAAKYDHHKVKSKMHILKIKQEVSTSATERCTQVTNLWLTAIHSVFDRVTADTQAHMTTTAEHCTAAIDLNAYRQERSYRDLITVTITPLCVSR